MVNGEKEMNSLFKKKLLITVQFTHLIFEPGFIGLTVIARIKKIMAIMGNQDNPGSKF